MAVTGSRFMELNKMDEMPVTNHALRRISEAVGFFVSAEEIAEYFLDSKQITTLQMLILGYRPAYGKRMAKGEKSWYFRFEFREREFIAILSQKGAGKPPTPGIRRMMPYAHWLMAKFDDAEGKGVDSQ